MEVKVQQAAKPTCIRYRNCYLQPRIRLHLPQTTETAILVFSRTAREEATGKRYGRGYRQDFRIAKQLIAHTEQAAQFSGLTVIRKYSARQQGANFGERFANAIEDVFAQGFSRVIAIGTDTPEITPGILRRIDKVLQECMLVTGPSEDGGVYAIGMSRAGWDRAAFLQVRWQTENVAPDLAAYCINLHLGHHVLAPLRDIDNGPAFNEWLHKAGAHTPVARNIVAGLMICHPFMRIEGALHLAPAFPQEVRRGPPVSA